MQHRVIFVLLDGLCLQTAQTCMGSLGALLAAERGVLLQVRSELPSLSRPLYECLLTGSTPLQSGIMHNAVVRRSNQQSVFDLASAQGRVTAASAYHWVSELYNHAPFDWDDYPDEAVFFDAEMLRQRYQPDLLMIHPMNIDDTGHHYGSDSSQYRNVVRRDDVYLSYYMAQWLQDGYQVIITADHGMNTDGTHGGQLAVERDVPLFLFGEAFVKEHKDPANVVKQTEICGLLCELLGLEHQKAYPQGVLHG